MLERFADGTASSQHERDETRKYRDNLITLGRGHREKLEDKDTKDVLHDGDARCSSDRDRQDEQPEEKRAVHTTPPDLRHGAVHAETSRSTMETAAIRSRTPVLLPPAMAASNHRRRRQQDLISARRMSNPICDGGATMTRSSATPAGCDREERQRAAILAPGGDQGSARRRKAASDESSDQSRERDFSEDEEGRP